MSETIDHTLIERGNRYGTFVGHAEVTQSMKEILKRHNLGENWNDLHPIHQEALEMILHKIGRIINGDPMYDDSWRDIAGYAELVVKWINKEVL